MRKFFARWLSLLALAVPAFAAEPWDTLQQGEALILMRHAATDPGVGDPPGFRLGECATQRNLSAQGRKDAESIGRLFAARGVAPAALYSSAWCRCIDTAQLAFPGLPVQALPALDSLFGDQGRAAGAKSALRQALKSLPRERVTVWVTHQVNVTALTGEYIAMGEAFVLRVRDGEFELVGRIKPPES